MPVGRRKVRLQHPLGLGLWLHRRLLLGLLLHVFTAPVCAQFSGSGSGSGSWSGSGLAPFFGSADGSGEVDVGSGSGKDLCMVHGGLVERIIARVCRSVHRTFACQCLAARTAIAPGTLRGIRGGWWRWGSRIIVRINNARAHLSA